MRPKARTEQELGLLCEDRHDLLPAFDSCSGRALRFPAKWKLTPLPSFPTARACTHLRSTTLPALLLLLRKTTNILGILQQQLNCIKLLRASET